jgi:hypothetical protein
VKSWTAERKGSRDRQKRLGESVRDDMIWLGVEREEEQDRLTWRRRILGGTM